MGKGKRNKSYILSDDDWDDTRGPTWVATPEQLQHWLVQQGLTPDEIDRFMEDCLEIWGLWVRPLGLTYDVEERSANETVEFLLRTRYARQQAAAKELEMALAQGLLV